MSLPSINERHPMANSTLFQSRRGRQVPATDAVNEAGGRAYRLAPKHALAQYAATGCLNATFYATAETQLEAVLALTEPLDPRYLAQVAVYARHRGYLKDLPALLLAVLATRDVARLATVFDQVCDDARMVRNFVQILRSGVTGRKSLGTAPKRLVRRWLENRSDEQLLRATIGQQPSLADLVKLVHPAPATPSRAAFYGWLLGRTHDATALPACVQEFERFKADPSGPVPDLPFPLLTALPLGTAAWQSLALRAPWNTTRMNLNTFARHGVFQDPTVVQAIAARLRDAESVRRARIFPYQLLTACHQVEEAVPAEIREALQAALEHSLGNVPEVPGRVVVCPDVSGSMQSPVTGHRRGATTVVRCVDVAALVAAAFLRRQPDTLVLPFSDAVVPVELNPEDSVYTNARRLASLPAGGTNCSAPLRALNTDRVTAQLVILVSDNQSWVDSAEGGRGTATMAAWAEFQQRNPGALLVCLDLQPGDTTPAAERADILNIGGFSDAVFEWIAMFTQRRLTADHWVGEIEKIPV
jgi:60 kDa SS-A/Ro ribonucleoprotein